jgi:hypothetical protein
MSLMGSGSRRELRALCLDMYNNDGQVGELDLCCLLVIYFKLCGYGFLFLKYANYFTNPGHIGTSMTRTFILASAQIGRSFELKSLHVLNFRLQLYTSMSLILVRSSISTWTDPGDKFYNLRTYVSTKSGI